MEYLCNLEETKAQPVISIRIITSVTNLFVELEKSHSILTAYLDELGEKPAGPIFAAYYNWDLKNLDVEIGFPLTKNICGKQTIQVSEIPGGKKATTFYTGPYKKIAPAYKALSEYISHNGYESGLNYEFYYNSIREVPEGELLTKIVYLLK